jgi:hypothetical protein
MHGVPAVVLDAAGLSIDSQIRCKWVTFADDARLLGEFIEDGTRRRDPGCPTGLPIYTELTDAGLGSPALFIVVSAIKGRHAAIPFHGRTLYFDLTDLPGDPNAADDQPPFRLQRRGYVGWNWLDSQRTEDRRMGAALARRLSDKAFAAFYHGIRSCLIGRNPTCLTKYLDASFNFRPWWGAGESRVGKDKFARYAWQSSPNAPQGESLWQEVAWCFLRGRLIDGEDELTFYRGWFYCRVERRNGAFAIAECDVSD